MAMQTVTVSEARANLRELLDFVQDGGTVVIRHYTTPIAALVPYQETTMYTTEIQAAADSDSWQAMCPAETISAERASQLSINSAQEAAAFVADNQNIASGTGWRVAVWKGTDPDLGVEPTATYTIAPITPEDIHNLRNADFADLAVLVIDTDGAVEVYPQSTAADRGARVIYDADRLDEYLDGTELTEDDAKQLAEELTHERA